jgi:hypothetical protein
MPYGYLGVYPSQVKTNSGILDVTDIAILENNGELGGSLELIESQTIDSNVAAVDFTNIKGSQYDVHFLEAINIKNAADDQQFCFRFSVGGTFDTDNDYQRALYTLDAAGNSDESRDNNINNMFFTLNQGNATNEKGNGHAYFYNLHNSSKMSYMTFQSTQINASGYYKMNLGGGMYDQTASVDGIRILMSNGSNIASGVFKLYGIKQL